MNNVVLLIESVRWKQVFVKNRLADRKLFVIVATDIWEAMFLLNIVEVDLVIGDITVRESNFLKFYEKIVIGRGIPIIFFSWWNLMNSELERCCLESIDSINRNLELPINI